MSEQTLPEAVKNEYEKASMAVNKKNYMYAVQLLTHIINIKPDFAKARQLLHFAEIKYFEENPPNIISQLLNSVSSFFQSFSAFICKNKGELHNAISIYERILRKDPKNVGILIKLGVGLKREGLKEASVVTLETAVSISGKNLPVYGLLGEIYSDIGQYDRARFCFKKVLEARPNDMNAERGLKNLDALTTIGRGFETRDEGGPR